MVMDRMYPSDFNVSESNSNGCFIKIDELNDMIAYGVLKLDETKLKEYHFDTRVTYNKEIYIYIYIYIYKRTGDEFIW